jgi:UDP-2,3-diacylglucosamine hydrolase
MNAVFISDLHLSEERPHITAAFFVFLAKKAQQFDRLYILGDFFDAWIGDDDDRPLATALAENLRALTDSGVQVFFQHGNRDFLLGNDYAARCGMQLLSDFHLLELGGEKYLLAHGDQFCTQDVAYQQFRTVVREPQWRHDFLAKSLQERRDIAQHLRARSREANSIKAEDIMDVTQAEVVSAMQQYGAHNLIHGHTHRPARHRLTLGDGRAAERVVLGEWGETFWYVVLESDGLQLLSAPGVGSVYTG